MNGPALDRILHLALEELLTGAGPTDRIENVLAAIRGGRGRAPRRRPLRLRFLAAAAAVLVLAVPAWLLLRDGPAVEPPPAVETVSLPGGATLSIPDGAAVEVSESPVPSVIVKAGTVTVAGPGGERSASAGQYVGLVAGLLPVIVDLPPEEERRRVEALLADALVDMRGRDFGDPAVRDLDKRRATAMGELRNLVEADDPAGAYGIARIAPLPPDPSRELTRRSVLELLLRDPELRARGVVERSLAEEPAVFVRDLLAAATEARLAGARARLESRYEAGPGAVQLRFLAAALALRGDDRGRAVLEDAIARLNPIMMVERLLDAAALHRLDNKRPWTAELRTLAGLVEEALARGDLDYARSIVLRIAYFHRGLAGEEPPRMSWLSDRVRRFEREHGDDVRSEDEIRALLRSMSD